MLPALPCTHSEGCASAISPLSRYLRALGSLPSAANKLAASTYVSACPQMGLWYELRL
jgi:hypothetical protein